MKKIILILLGVGIIVGVLMLVGRERVKGTQETEGQAATEDSEDTELVEQYDPGKSIETPSAPISDAVLTLIDPQTDYQTRLDAMRKLGYEIPPQDIEALMTFLAAGIPANAKISGGAYNSVRNDLYEVLLRQKQLPEGMGQLLVDVVNNPDQDGMWRNYCIQFMPEFYERQSKETGGLGSALTRQEDTSPDGSRPQSPRNEMALVQESLWKALDERENSNAGTALLGLNRLSRNHPEFDRQEIDAAMLDLASDKEASVANRITAIRMCGEQGNAQAVETARDLAENGDTTMLRCAAIATLGDLGSDEDVALLQSYAASPDPRIQKIAQITLGRIEAKRQ